MPWKLYESGDSGGFRGGRGGGRGGGGGGWPSGGGGGYGDGGYDVTDTMAVPSNKVGYLSGADLSGACQCGANVVHEWYS